MSDGEHFITATLGSQLRLSNRIKEVVPNTLIKVFGFERETNPENGGRVSIKLKKLSIISQDPGHRFGNPAYFYDVCDDQEKGDTTGQGIVSTDAPVETQICQQLLRRNSSSSSSRRNNVDQSQTLLELYSCQYPINKKPVDSKIPQNGWHIDSHGTGPGPTCRWIPAAKSPPKSSVSTIKTDPDLRSDIAFARSQSWY